ncbi:MAG: hypothetical protein ACRBC3_19040 [Burkholderiaceae bacterium]
MQPSKQNNSQYSRAERALINAYRAGDTKAAETLAAHLRQTQARSSPGNQSVNPWGLDYKQTPPIETKPWEGAYEDMPESGSDKTQRYIVTSPEGKRYKVTTPPGATEQEAIDFVRSSLSDPQLPKSEEPNRDPERVMQAIRAAHKRAQSGDESAAEDAKALAREYRRLTEGKGPVEHSDPSLVDQAKAVGQSALAGLSDPFFGASRLIAEAGSAVSSLGGMVPNPISEFFDDEVRQYKGHKADMNEATADARGRAGFEGMDVARLSTNIVNPINVLPLLSVASKARQAGTGISSLLRLGLAGSKAGALAATVQPADDESEVPYATQKLGQAASGAAIGGLSAPVASVLGGAVARQVKRVQTMLNKPSSQKVLADALDEAGVKADDIGQEQLVALRGQIDEALRTGKSVNPAAMVREQDFAELGMTSTKGQVMRDPAQFAREKNLSGLDEIGSPLLDRFNEQNRLLNSKLLQHAEGASEPVEAGRQITSRLLEVDQEAANRVSTLYKRAAQSEASGEVPTTGLAQDAAQIIDDFREKIPGGIVARLRSYGFLDGKQTKHFDFVEAESLLKLINSHGNKVDKAEGAALDQLREAVKRAIVTGADDGGPFATARHAASQRFKLHDAIPALKKVSQGDAEPDLFVDKFVMRAPVSQVKGMAELLDEGTKQEVKSQIGDHLRRAAFGHDFANDAPFKVNGFNNAVRKLGSERLRAFFAKNEVEELMRIGRVAHYKDSAPANAAVNRSNTASALRNLLRATGGGLSDAPVLNVAAGIGRRHRDIRAVQDSLAGGLMSGRPNITDTAQLVNGLLAGGSAISNPLLMNRAVQDSGPLLRLVEEGGHP